MSDTDMARSKELLRAIFADAAAQVANDIAEKQLSYGDAFSKSAKVLALLYPQGVPADQFKVALFLARMTDRMFQIALSGGFNPKACSAIAGLAILAITESKAETRDRVRSVFDSLLTDQPPCT